MREIKFRAWDGYRMTTAGISFNNTTGVLGGEVFGSKGDIQEMPVMQYIGLKDKNGVEIYEGDIVDAFDWGVGPETQKPICRSVVEWDSQEAAWQLNPQPTEDRYDLFRSLAVIGNIYENPALLND